MLPIDTLSSAAADLLRERGYDPEGLLAAVRLDLAPDGRDAECTLALTGDGAALLRVLPVASTVEEFPLADYRQPYVDSHLSTCRLLCTYTPPGGDGYTVGVGYATNACKGRLFVFVSVMEAAARGERLTGEEAMFDSLRKPPEEKAGTKGMLRRALSLFRLPAGLYLFLAFAVLFEIATDLLRPYLAGRILFDEIIADGGRYHSERALYLCVGVIVAMSVLRYLLILLRNSLINYSMAGLVIRLKGRLFRKLQSLSIAYFHHNPLGRLLGLLNRDVGTVRSFFGGHLASFFIYLAEFLTVLVLLFLMNWRLSLLILVPVPLIVLIYRRAFPHLRRLNIRAHREESAVSSLINDSLNGIRVVKAFAKEEEESERLRQRLVRLYRVNLASNLFASLLGPAVALLIYLANQTIWGLGGYYVIDGVLTYGDFATYLGYVGMVFAPLEFFSNLTMTVGTASEAASRIINLLESEPEVKEDKTPLAPEAIRGEIDFADVRFHYVPNRPILRGVSFHLEAGDHVGLVGETGSGKSTIANLLLRMYDVTGGTVKIDGHDVRRLSQAVLRRHVAIISQEIHLFIGTVADNIRFGRPEATDLEVIAAARAAGAHEFIMALPEGYETVVGIGGRALSGGERQRISIARALVSNPSILILDEATAAMDNETERRIATAIEGLTAGRTTISIAHRLSTLRGCNKIMSLSEGRIAEMGTREELIERGGIFARLYHLQNEQLLHVMKGEDHDI